MDYWICSKRSLSRDLHLKLLALLELEKGLKFGTWKPILWILVAHF